MSEKEKEAKKEIKEPGETPIISSHPTDIFQAFDNMWEEFRRDFWMPWRFRGGPSMRGLRLQTMPREAYADLVDTGKEYKVFAEVPGIPKDKIDITITKDGIEIFGKARVERKEEDKGYIVRERGYSEIHRRMAFPEEIVPEKAEATLNDGLLEIKVPKKIPTPEVKQHKLQIK